MVATRQPTMHDVAARAGVGIGTVSRVVNDGPSVRPRTAQRVRQAIAELGYRPNDIARALRPGMTSRMIALLVGDLTNPFYAAIAKAVVDEIRAGGYAVMLMTVDEDAAAEERAVRDLLSRRVAGLMLVPDRSDHRFLRDTAEGGVPIVFVDRPGNGVDADSVLLDNHRGGYLATRHLLDQGHRDIAVLVSPSYYTTAQRLRGYRQALRQAGVRADPDLVVTLSEGSADAAGAATRDLLARRRPPTAMFATTNFVCEGALRELRRQRRTMAVVGFDDFRLADLLPTPATVVSGDVAEMGRRAAQLLLDRVGGDGGPPRREVLPVRITPRGSGERPPAGGRTVTRPRAASRR